jgi:hypothetical protein
MLHHLPSVLMCDTLYRTELKCYIMKRKNTQNTLIRPWKKVRNKFNIEEIFYTHPDLDVRVIEDVIFVPVLKSEPEDKHQTIFYMRKDSLEPVVEDIFTK